MSRRLIGSFGTRFSDLADIVIYTLDSLLLSL